MIYGVYSILDSAAGVFTAPTIDISDASAVRGFQQALSNTGSLMNFKPDDFSLYQIASFDVETGVITPITPPFRLTVGSKQIELKEVANESV